MGPSRDTRYEPRGLAPPGTAELQLGFQSISRRESGETLWLLTWCFSAQVGGAGHGMASQRMDWRHDRSLHGEALELHRKDTRRTNHDIVEIDGHDHASHEIAGTIDRRLVTESQTSTL